MNTATALAEAPDIRDFIVNIKGSAPMAVTCSYSIILENHCDFIISRKTPKTERILAILTSQSLFYIKDQKTGGVEEANEVNIKAFLKDLSMPLKFDQLKWLKAISKMSFAAIQDVISDDISIEMCRHGYYDAEKSMQWLKPYYLKNAKLFQFLHKTFPFMDETTKYGSDTMRLIYEIDENFGGNEARHFASQLVISGIENLGCYRGYYNQVAELVELVTDERFKLNFRSFTEYILFGMYSQGLCGLSGFWREYKDHLSMQLDYYGKIVEKYPRHFATEHNILTLKFNMKKKDFDRKKFGENMEQYLPLAYKGQDYSIVIPTEPEQLADEGVALSHCVKDYIKRVVEKECAIVFLRYTKRPDIPLVTIQITNNVVCQAQGQFRRLPSIKEKKFICNWAVKNNLEVRL